MTIVRLQRDSNPGIKKSQDQMLGFLFTELRLCRPSCLRYCISDAFLTHLSHSGHVNPLARSATCQSRNIKVGRNSNWVSLMISLCSLYYRSSFGMETPMWQKQICHPHRRHYWSENTPTVWYLHHWWKCFLCCGRGDMHLIVKAMVNQRKYHSTPIHHHRLRIIYPTILNWAILKK